MISTEALDTAKFQESKEGDNISEAAETVDAEED